MSLTIEQLRALDSLVQSGLDQPEHSRRSWFDALEFESPSMRAMLQRALFSERNVESGTFMGTVPKIERGEREASGLSPNDVVGPYRLEALLGEGGSASVWRAQRVDGTIKRAVALKLPYFVGNTRGWAERIERERDVLASLNHPNIATIYESGIAENGRPWLALEHIKGERIDTYVSKHCIAGDALIRLFLQVVRASEHAHARGVIHRDIKPHNILVTTNEKEEATVKLLDFGIAKLLDENAAPSDLTRMHGRPFTPEYASLEQLRGETITTATDVYALGVVFYELLCGERPFETSAHEDSLRKLEQRLATVTPLAPSQRLTQAPRSSNVFDVVPDLDAIALKAIHSNNDKRYQTASAFADDLERFLRHEVISARLDSNFYRASLFVKRNRLAVAAAVGVGASTLIGLTVALWQAQEAREQRAIAQAEARRVTVALEEAQLQRTLAAQSATRADQSASLAVQEAILSKTNAIRAEREAKVAAEQRSLAEKSERKATEQKEKAEDETKAKRIEAEKANAIKNFLTSLLKANEIDIVGSKQKREQSVERLLQVAVPNLLANLDDQREVKVELLDTVAGLLTDLGMFADAKLVVQQRIAILMKSEPDAELALAKSRLQLSRIEANLGNSSAAIALATTIIDGNSVSDRTEALKQRIQALSQRADQRASSDLQSALADATLAVQLSEKEANNTSEQISALHSLSLANAMRGQNAESSAAMERAIKVSEIVNGASSARTAWLRHRWSELLFRERNMAQAIEQIDLAVTAFKTEFGDDGYHAARALVWSGRIRSATGDFASAVSQLTKGIESLEKIANRIDPQQIAVPKTWAAYAYLEQGRIEPARMWAEAATKYYPESSAEKSTAPYLNTQIGLGIYQFHAGDYKAAREIYRRLDQLMVKVGLKNNPERWMTANRRALCSLYLGDIEEAINTANEVLQAHENVPKTHGSPATAARATLAIAELGRGQVTAAKTHIKNVESALSSVSPNERNLAYLQDHAQLLIQGTIALEENDVDAAYALFTRALAMLENRQHPDSVFMANARAHLAMAALRKRNFTQASDLLAKSKRAFDAQPLHAAHFRTTYEKASQILNR
jgi:eukaryotic-like serine/threonine-protein kinase